MFTVGFDIAQIVDAQHRDGDKARRSAAEQAVRGDCAGQGEHGAARSDETEEDEYEYLTQIVVAIGVFAADIAPAGHETGDADENEPPVAGQHDDDQSAQAGDQRVDTRRGQHLPGIHARGDETCGTA